MDKQEIVDHYTGQWSNFYGRHIPDLREHGKEVTGNCPLCEEDNGHFYVSVETGQFDCKKCDASGDAFTFYAQMHGLDVRGDFGEVLKHMAEDAGIAVDSGHRERRSPQRSTQHTSPSKTPMLSDIQDITEQTVKWFSERGRAFSWETWRRWAKQAVYHPGGHRCIAFSQQNGGYHVWLLDGGEQPWRFADGGHSDILGEVEGDAVYLVEGEWDLMAAWDAGIPSIVTNSAGCGTWKKEWSERFRGLDVSIIYDNDLPGQDGMQKVAQALQWTAKRIHLVEWPEGLIEGYDLRDWIKDGHTIQELSFREWEPEGIPKSEADELPDWFAELEVRQTERDFVGLDTGFTHMNRVNNGLMPGLFVLAGPPSCGKTTLAKQIVDQVAELNEVPCLFFSLEQSKEELRIKTLSRLSKAENRDIMRGRLNS